MIGSTSSKNDNWWTKWDDYHRWCKIANVQPRLDVCADNESSKCDEYITKEQDALSRDWITEHGVVDVWCNPPLSKTKAFMLKAKEQWEKHGMNILMVVPTGVISRKYFRELWYIFKAGRIDIIPIDRPKFLENGKESRFQAHNDYILILFKAIR